MKNIDNELLVKLDIFIRKYYKNRLIRGLLWSAGIISLLFLLMVLPEAVVYFSKLVRAILFFVFVSILLFVLVRLVFIPVLQLFRIGKIISNEQAAYIIGKHFSEISDKLLNTLQLIKASETPQENSELLKAGIMQKTRTLRVFNFENAINFRKNYKYLRIVIIPVLIIVALAVFTPGTISEPAKRLVTFNREYAKPLPYELSILNRNFTAVQQQDFEVKARITGDEIPADIILKTGSSSFKMRKEKGFVFSYNFKSLQANTEFQIVAGDILSDHYTIRVLPKPIILNFDIKLVYPPYTGKKPEIIENQGDLMIPEGTAINWNFFTKDVEKLHFLTIPAEKIMTEKTGNRYSFNHIAKSNFTYKVTPSNGFIHTADSLNYNLVVVKDGFPSIYVVESSDTSTGRKIYFKGTLKDDYGFTRLNFNYALRKSGGQGEIRYSTEEIPVNKNMNNQVFYFAIDEDSYLNEPGSTLEYFFEVWDNDMINGFKSVKTEIKTMATPTIDEISKTARQNYEDSESAMQQSVKQSKSLSKSINDLNKKMIEQDKVTWQEKKKMEDMMKTAEEIEKKIEETKKRNEQNISNEEKYLETSERIIKKQKDLNEMMDQLFPEELKKMIEEMKAMLNQMDKEKLDNMLEKMKMSTKELENMLDRNLSLMKQIEFDRKLEETVKEMRKTSEELEKLAEKTDKQMNLNEDLLKQMEKLNEKSDSLFSASEKLKKEGEKLEDPVALQDPEKAKKEVNDNLSEGKESLKKGQNKKSAESQKKAASKMKSFADNMESANQESEDSQNEEDAANIRMILENLVRLSFEQESLIKESGKVSRYDPKTQEIMIRQKDFRDKMRVIEDSLNAIAKRQIEVKPAVTKELTTINSNIEAAIEQFEARNFSNVVTRQQYVMTSINNLALLLNEALQKMNEQQSMSMQSKSGNKSCNNPSAGKKGKKSAKDMKEMQSKIGEQLKKMKEGLEKGKKDPKGGREQMNGMNKELAKLAAQQEALRNEMQKYQDQMGEKGIKNNSGLNDAMREMEQVEKDIVNKRISQETLNRQQNIMSRLLESEKAELEREKEERRESTEAKSQKKSNLEKNFEYKPNTRSSADFLKFELPGLQSFYKTKVNNYFVKIEK